MEQAKYAVFPIDNKHIMEDFSDVIHDGDYLELRLKGFVKQAFYHKGLLWELQYTYGGNFFSVTSMYCPSKESFDEIKEKIMTLNYDEYEVKVNIRDLSNGFLCQFLKQID